MELNPIGTALSFHYFHMLQGQEEPEHYLRAPHDPSQRVQPEIAAAAQFLSVPYVNPRTIPSLSYSGLTPEL